MKQIVKLALVPAALSLGVSTAAVAQKKAAPAAKKPAAAPAAKGASTKAADGFTRYASGLEYKVIKHGTGKHNPIVGDHIEMFIHVHIKDSILFDSRKMYNATKPVSFVIAKPRGNGDVMEGFMKMVEGDSVMMRVPVDSMKKSGAQLMPWMKEGMMVEYNVAMVSVRSDAEEKAHADVAAKKQTTIDDAKLQEYFKAHNITPKKSPAGVYYVIKQEGTGEHVKAGQKVSVNYTGSFMDGTHFDSNTDSNFHHLTPFELTVGKGMVIKGWDEGLQQLKNGSVATLYIPSALAYGPQDQRSIPGNSILIFDVQILDAHDVADQPKIDDKQIKDYLEKNHIEATKTASGLYYVINQKGLGEKAKAGQKVTMNYTGKLLNGTTFDSNTDPKFGHVSPFSFTLGVGQVIKGWDEGVQLFNIGSKGTLFIPSAIGYGEHGAGGQIPANAVLVFDVEMVSIDK